MRVGVMILTLVGVILLMKKMNSPNAFSTAGNESVNLCPTRVSSLSVIGRFAIVQEGLNWYRTGDSGRTELDPVAVEKWFGQNCKVSATKEGANEGATPLVTLAYVSGLPMTLLVSGDGVFTFNQSHFRSLELSQAITALEHLPNVVKPGQNTNQ